MGEEGIFPCTPAAALELLKSSGVSLKGKHAVTFPSRLPFFALDRIYYRNLKCMKVDVLRKGLWNQLSDHLPTVAEFEFN